MSIISVIFAVLLIYIFSLDQFYYPNYSFSHYHFDPQKLLLIFSAAIFVWLIYFFKKQRHPTDTALLKAAVGSLLLFNTLPLLGQTLGRSRLVLAYTSGLPQKIIQTEYGDKYKFIQFVNRSTPPDSRILIPPDMLPWKHTGSIYLMQSWLYPRRVFSAASADPISNLNYNYILISSESDGKTKLTWPDFYIPAKEVIIYDWQKNAGLKYENIIYQPDKWAASEPWGLVIPVSGIN